MTSVRKCIEELAEMAGVEYEAFLDMPLAEVEALFTTWVEVQEEKSE